MPEDLNPYNGQSEFPEENPENNGYTGDQNSAEIPENKDRKFLTERDAGNLLKAGESLVRQFEADFPDYLPKVIILPDISSRPFAYFFEPILAELAKKRGCEKPAFVFFKTGRYISPEVSDYETHELDLKMKEEKSGLDEVICEARSALQTIINEKPTALEGSLDSFDHLISEQEQVQRKYLSLIEDIDDYVALTSDESNSRKRQETIDGYFAKIEEAEELITKYEENIVKLQAGYPQELAGLCSKLENIENIMKSAFELRAKVKERFAARATEIKDTIGPNFKTSDVAIIDEFINEGFSIKQIRDAFGDDGIAAYTLLSTNNSSYYEGGLNYRENPLRGETGPIKVGMQDPHFTNEKREKCYSFGFDFIEKMKETHDNSPIGVTKKDENGALLTDSSYSKGLPKEDRNRTAMAELRTELREVGKQLRDKLFANGRKPEIENLTKSEDELSEQAISEMQSKLLDPSYLPSAYELVPFLKDPNKFEYWPDFLARNKIYEILTMEYIDKLSDYLIGRISEYKKSGKSPVLILEVGAGNGKLSHFLGKKLEEKAPGNFKLIATDSGKDKRDEFYPVERVDYREALKEYQPDIVLCSWMPLREDWSADFRSTASVKEYILIGDVVGACGDPWLTYGDPSYKSEEERKNVGEAPYKQDGFEMTSIDNANDMQISSLNFSSNSPISGRSWTDSFYRK